ncbi:glutamine synthetase family protein [Streptomyces sp. TLI_185]|uniref:glutamine synthetase family protein n=1 Tax=Streptomyces sp. TLI_185 TaxID=2485151 RepID=UPI000F508EF8|nr:glutamine synthetase family protein [Streptomyces sp. TLI_185]RPF39385.1 glutamine synthetase [Streptomyces sp. TLI_185]
MSHDEPLTEPGPWPAGTVSPAVLREYVERGEITTVRFAVPDMQGRPKGKMLSAPVFVERMNSEGEMCAYVLATDINMTPLDGFDLTGWQQGYGDLGVKADPASMRLLPHQPGTALVIGEAFHHNGTPVEVAPRRMLRTQLERLVDIGYHVAVGTEVEFLLYQGSPQDAHEAGYQGLRLAWAHNLDYALQHPPEAADFFHHLHEALCHAGIPVEAIKTEGAAGQVEVTFVYGDVMAACDAYTAFRLIVQDIAERRGMTPVFMAAPSTGVGSGMHLHLSLWSAHGNAFTYHRGEDLPPVMERAIAGLLSGMPHLAPLYAPTTNSYKRYAPHTFAPTRYTWGFDNRGCAIRITGVGENAHLEIRLPGADANLYLALTAACAAIIHGIQDHPDLPPPCEGDPYTATDAAPVPVDLSQALVGFDGHKIVHDVLGETVMRHYTRAAQAEIAWQRAHVTDVERARGLGRA